MTSGYCSHCQQQVMFKRYIGLGTLLLVVLTSGVWLLAVFFYPARCCMCLHLEP